MHSMINQEITIEWDKKKIKIYTTRKKMHRRNENNQNTLIITHLNSLKLPYISNINLSHLKKKNQLIMTTIIKKK